MKAPKIIFYYNNFCNSMEPSRLILYPRGERKVKDGK